MIRFLLILAVAGGVLAFKGIANYRKVADAPATPTSIELHDLETSRTAPSTWLTVGEHLACYDEHLAYSVNDKVKWRLYPIISKQHEGAAKPEEEVSEFVAMVKTTSELPPSRNEVVSITGYAHPARDIETDKNDLINAIRENYQHVDSEAMIVIEEGISPSQVRDKAMGSIGFGAALLAAAAAMAVFSFRRKAPASGAGRASPDPAADADEPPASLPDR